MDDGLTGSYSESEGPLRHSGLISPGLSRNRKLTYYRRFDATHARRVLSAGDAADSAFRSVTLITGGYTRDVTYSGDANKVGIGPLTETVAAAVAAPEPSSVALMLLGIGLLFAMRKRVSAGLPQAS